MKEEHFYLKCTVNILNLINMWPTETESCKFVKQFYILGILIMSAYAMAADFVIQFYDDDFTFPSFDSLIGATALCSVIYTSTCFFLKKYEIQRLVRNLKIFEQYITSDSIEETEKNAAFYTKIFIMYGIIGNIFYACLPFLSYSECKKHRPQHMIKYGQPCGAITRYFLPFKHESFPLSMLVMLEQAFISTLGTTIVMTVTMLVCGLLTHMSTNLKYLKNMLLNISNISDDKINKHVNLCVKYHTDIIEFSDQTNNAFSVMMLVHITWTSFIISILGAEIILETNYWNSFRFVMHLGGWLGMLFIVCFYGQILIDDSTAISRAVYDSKWYEKSPKIRKSLVLILLRSQRPLVLKAAGINVMSLATFLGVLYSAYSYFTLLLKIKP